MAGRTKIRWESDMKDLRIMEVKKLDKMDPGSVKYLKRLTLSNSEVVASDYEEEVFRGMLPVDCYICTHIPGWTASYPRRLESSECMNMQCSSPVGVCCMKITMYVTEFFVCHWSKGFHGYRKCFTIIKVTLHSNLTTESTLLVTFEVLHKYIFVFCFMFTSPFSLYFCV